MIDVTKEQLCSLSEGARSIPGHPHIATMIRWWQKGCNGVKLEVVKFGRRTFTSYEALGRFGQALAQADRQPAPTPSHRRQPQSARERQIAEAEAYCTSKGI